MTVKVLSGFALFFLVVALTLVALMLLAPASWASVTDFLSTFTMANKLPCACMGQ